MNLSLRLLWVTSVFALLFVTLFTRLWFVQVAEGAVFAEQGLDLQLGERLTPGARGSIVDSQGIALATTRMIPTIVIDQSQLPTENEERLIQELAGLMGVEPTVIAERLAAEGQSGLVVVADATSDEVMFILTHRDRFPGVEIEFAPRREYPEAGTMAHVLGYMGTVSEQDLEENSDRSPLDTVGKAGVEKTYDASLQGTPGHTFYQIRPSGAVEPGTVPSEVPANPGNTVVLTLDLGLQRQVERSLADGLEWARSTAAGQDAKAASVVVLNAKTGEVLAMASFPTFDPQEFVGGIAQSDLDVLVESSAFNNLAIQGQFPPGSTFKAITYATAVEEGLFPEEASEQSPEGSFVCDGVLRANGLDDGSQQLFTDPGHGLVDLHAALGASCNIYFWQVALAIWNENKNTGNENVLQDMARRLGLGDPTGVDLPFEASGQIPDRQLFEEWAETATYRLAPERLDPGPLWKGGDLMNVAIGQGEVLATPLQMTVAYAAMSNGGTVWQPTVVDRIETSDGEIITQFEPNVVREIHWSPPFREFFLEDLGRVTTSSIGTARKAFSPMESAGKVGGKTGTSTTTGKGDTSWFVGVAPLTSPEYVIAVVVDEGGSGGTVAAPIARQIFQYLYEEEIDPIAAGL